MELSNYHYYFISDFINQLALKAQMTYLTRAPDPKGFRGVSKATHFRSWPSQIRRSCFSGPESNEVED